MSMLVLMALRSELRLNKVEFMASIVLYSTVLHRTCGTVQHCIAQHKARKHGPDSHHSPRDKIQYHITHMH